MRHPKHRRRLALLVVGLLSFGLSCLGLGCEGCAAGGRAPMQFVARDTLALLAIPSLKRFLTDARANAFRLLSDADRTRLTDALGVDLSKSNALERAGLATHTGLAAFIDRTGHLIVAVRVNNQSTVSSYLRARLSRHYGDLRFVKKAAGLLPVYHAQRGGTQSVAAWTFHRSHLLFVRGLLAHTDLPALLQRVIDTRKTLANTDLYKKCTGDYGRGEPVFFVNTEMIKARISARSARKLQFVSENARAGIREGQRLAEQLLGFFAGIGGSASFLRRRVVLRGTVALSDEAGKGLADALRAGRRGEPLAAYIGKEATAAGRLAFRPRVLAEMGLEMLPPRTKRRLYRWLDRWEARYNINLRRDVLEAFSGRFAIASFPELNSDDKQEQEAPPQWLVLARLAKPKMATRLLERFERFLVMKHFDVVVDTTRNRRRYTLQRRGLATLRWSIAKNLLLVGSPGRVEESAALVSGSGGGGLLESMDNYGAWRSMKREHGWSFFAASAALRSSLARWVLDRSWYPMLARLGEVVASTEFDDDLARTELQLWFAPLKPGR